jgi:hypothetical protein
MVTKKEQQDIILHSKGALWLVAATLVIGFIAFMMARGPHDSHIAEYDLSSPNRIIEQGPSGTPLYHDPYQNPEKARQAQRPGGWQ